MKVMTILGTRPEIIRLSRIIPKLDKLSNHILVHTGQNYDPNLSTIFFDDLGLRAPDYYLNATGQNFAEQIGDILAKSEKIMSTEKPDLLVILGDTNSALSAIVAKRMGIPVLHMEAGNRCYDDRVPEEVNRRIIDHCSDVLMPYTERSRANLLREGIDGNRIYVIGNPIHEVIKYYGEQVSKSNILSDLHLISKEYYLVTMHRAENVDIKERLINIVQALERLQEETDIPVIVSTHPHTKARMQEYLIHSGNKEIRFLSPFGFFDFITLEKNAYCVISDSGTVQEECCILKVPNVTIRDVTERPETIECGSNMLSGANADNIIMCVHTVCDQQNIWWVPPEYQIENVSGTAVKIILGYHNSEIHKKKA
jgi:UDP-N-acetylglucosamine 2-epimerase (non-hydrolysing)